MAEVTDYARKYRPSRLSEYVGNKTIVESALRFLRLPEESRPQVLLLHGNAGCGKTSFARLICSCYSCETPLENGDACGTCPTCQEFQHYIETGDSDGLMDIKEVDTTDDNGKKAVDELIDDMSAPSLVGGWKCYIFDECHMLTQSAQARLLKTIEEPPPKVLICLCTTNPEKILPTIHTRCHYEFRVQKPTRAELIALLQRVAQEEGVRAETRALSLVATKGDMVPRTSLHQLQKVVQECGEVTYESAVKVLNIVADKYYFTFYKLLLQAHLVTYKYIMFINEIAAEMPLEQFIDGLIAFTVRGIYVYNNVAVDGLDASELKPYGDLFAKFTPNELVFMMTYLTSLRGDPDVEIKLLKLGYTGIANAAVSAGVAGPDSSELANLSSSVAADSRAGSEAIKEQTMMTSEERDTLISDAMKEVDMDDVLSMFNGVKVQGGL